MRLAGEPEPSRFAPAVRVAYAWTWRAAADDYLARTLALLFAAALCAWHAAGTVGATKARTSVLFASPFLRGGEDAWWALAAAAPAWLGSPGTGFVSESATESAAVAPLADALDSAALFAAAAVAAGAAVPGRAHETQTAAALAGVGAAVAALAGKCENVKMFRRGAGAGKTKTG